MTPIDKQGPNAIALPNGIILDPDAGWAADIRRKARARGFPGLRAFVATQSDGQRSYILVEGQDVIFESQSFEAVCCHIDMMAMDRDMPR
jgi:hypothetical protein